ncbi:hypothetical protein M5K25_025229 [Dendrobium thyrsiflorum]|uniref:Uncharacterized protein n=1 Tax=Dendrobium thyrsiflorum TaxID=117978 RepID=A0ABD0U3Z9_DENTH
MIHPDENSLLHLNNKLGGGQVESQVISHRDMMCTTNGISLPTDNLSYTEENYLSVCGCRIWDPVVSMKALVDDLFRKLLLIFDLVLNNSLERMLFDKPESMLGWKQRLHLIRGIASRLFYLHKGWIQTSYIDL